MLKKLPYLISLLLVVIWLTGCASTASNHDRTTQNIELVIKPVLESLPERPVWEIDKVDLIKASDEDVAKAYLITVEQCTAYSTQLEMLLLSTTRKQ